MLYVIQFNAPNCSVSLFLSDDNAHENEILTWDDETSLDVWADSYCNAINGTDASLFHSFIERNETLYIFTNDICRSIYVQYEQDVKVKGWYQESDEQRANSCNLVT